MELKTYKHIEYNPTNVLEQTIYNLTEKTLLDTGFKITSVRQADMKGNINVIFESTINTNGLFDNATSNNTRD
ncbi:hypothetical protein COC69_12645 [Bacillus cereus]|uniref:Uncharacterized protein n=1 Tax=Bacillus cereus TaxID=1396 RepID=A0A9X7CNM9_BACCE|nr:hypothetical protein [Bacillus cereus]PGS79302.1 hypothetical protein COC69_12645 [Bacillus cereus]